MRPTAYNWIDVRIVLAGAVIGVFLWFGTGCDRANSTPLEPGTEVTLAANQVAQAGEEAASTTYFTMNEAGELLRPVGFREWVYVGTPLTPNELNPPEAPFPEFHNVYIDPVSWAHYRDTGTFRDGTVLIKELVLVGARNAVSGNGYFMGEFTGLEAAIKSAEHFPDEPGNWAYFSFGHSYPLAETAQAFPAVACNACHAVSAAEDFVFTQYYPVLRAGSASVDEGAMPMDAAAREGMASTMQNATAAMMVPRAEAGTSPGPVPTDLEALFPYLQEQGYGAFTRQESAPHGSRGPHLEFGQPVRVYLSDDLAASLDAGNDSHPAGSTAIKEIFREDGTTLAGWAVAIKTQEDSDRGNGWFWVEFISTTDPTLFGGGEAGNGVPLCTGCHALGRDNILTSFPLQ